MSYTKLGKAVDTMFTLLGLLIVICVPLALWKLVDICIWVYNKVEVTIK